MQCLKSSTSSIRLPARSASRRPLVVKAFKEDTDTGKQTVVAVKQAEPAPQQAKPLVIPEWVPEPLRPVVEFFDAQDVSLTKAVAPIRDSGLYQKYLQQYLESETAKDSFGWKKLPEAINGRAAMLGFLAGAGAELFGRGTIISQLAAAPGPVLLTLLLISVGSAAPVFYGSKGDYLESLQDVYSLPQGWFTEQNERVNGRVAMLGLFSLIVIELFIGHALL